MDQDNSGSPFDSMRSSANLIASIAAVLAVSVEVFLRRSHSFGERYMGLRAAAVILIVPFYTVLWPGYDIMPLMGFLLAYLCMCLVIRIRMATRRSEQVHSYYNGYPRILTLTRRVSERTAKCLLEPMLVFVSGALTLAVNEPLGFFLFLAAGGLVVTSHMTATYSRVRALDMFDSYVEQQQVADTFRKMRGGDRH